MATDLNNLLLRINTRTGLTTKGTNLDGSETDDNFELFYTFLRELLASLNIQSYSGATTYSTGAIVKYNSDLWIMVNVSDQTGVEPGTDPTVWQITSIGQFIGNQAKQKYVTSLVIKMEGNTDLSNPEEGDGLIKIKADGTFVVIQYDGTEFNPEKEFLSATV